MSDSAIDKLDEQDERLAQLDTNGAEVKRSVDELLAATRRGDTKRIFYWVGVSSHQLVKLGQECAGKNLTQPKKQAIIRP